MSDNEMRMKNRSIHEEKSTENEWSIRMIVLINVFHATRNDWIIVWRIIVTCLLGLSARRRLLHRANLELTTRTNTKHEGSKGRTNKGWCRMIWMRMVM